MIFASKMGRSSVALLLLSSAGCVAVQQREGAPSGSSGQQSSTAILDTFHWFETVSEGDARLALHIADSFVSKELPDVQVGVEALGRVVMRAGHSSSYLRVNYYNTQMFPKWRNGMPVAGGYPDAFSILVDLEGKKVVHVYMDRF